MFEFNPDLVVNDNDEEDTGGDMDLSQYRREEDDEVIFGKNVFWCFLSILFCLIFLFVYLLFFLFLENKKLKKKEMQYLKKDFIS